MAQAQDDVMNEVMEMLEASPDTGPASLVTPGNDIPAKREKLAILVSTGKAKEAIGVQLTHEQFKRLSDKDVEKYNKRHEAYIGSKTTESLIDSFLMFVSKGLGMVVKIDDVEKLQQDLKNDYIINHELSSLAGGIALSCGRLWPWPMPPSLRPNTSNLRRNLSPTCWICTTHHQPRTPAETRKVIHSKVLMKYEACTSPTRNLAGTL